MKQFEGDIHTYNKHLSSKDFSYLIFYGSWIVCNNLTPNFTILVFLGVVIKIEKLNFL